MKRIKQIALICSVLLSERSIAQIQNVSLCAGHGTVLVAVNSSSLAGPAYSMNPGGLTSPNPSFAVTPATSTDYTIYVTGTNSNSALVTTSFIYSVTLNGTMTKNLTVGPVTCASPTMLIAGPNQPGLTYQWLPSGATGSSVIGHANFSTPTNSIAATLTLHATDAGNSCVETTIVTLLQNTYPPDAQIAGWQPACFVSTVVLTNFSSSGIPPGTYTSTAPILASVWKGPAPQVPAYMSTNYVAQTSGTYSLTVIDQNNGCLDSATVTVDLKPSAAFLHSVTNGIASFSTVSGGNSANTYKWDFGDGSYSGTQNPVHTYQSSGSYLVKLKVSSSAFATCIDSTIQSVNITGIPCLANSSFSLVPSGTAQVWNAIPAYPWNIAAAEWQWGDGSSSNILYTSHQYPAAGNYNICLSVTVSCVSSSSSCTTYSVYRSSQLANIIAVNVIDPSVFAGMDAIQEEQNRSVRVMPNPNNGKFRIGVAGFTSSAASVSVMDPAGRILFDKAVDISSGAVEMNVENPLDPGIYFVIIESEGYSRSVKMIILR